MTFIAVRCPHCQELFPKNDFEKFHASGLDEHGVFDPKKADRALLFNTEHADKSDPKHAFGVDDGAGYVAPDGKRWRFISAYLIYGTIRTGDFTMPWSLMGRSASSKRWSKSHTYTQSATMQRGPNSTSR